MNTQKTPQKAPQQAARPEMVKEIAPQERKEERKAEKTSQLPDPTQGVKNTQVPTNPRKWLNKDTTKWNEEHKIITFAKN